MALEGQIGLGVEYAGMLRWITQSRLRNRINDPLFLPSLHTIRAVSNGGIRLGCLSRPCTIIAPTGAVG
jgi:hypothetical protein